MEKRNIHISTFKLNKHNKDYEECIVEITEPNITYEYVWDTPEEEMEEILEFCEVSVWIEGKCAKCGKPVSFIPLFSEEVKDYLPNTNVECNCGTFNGYGYLLKEEDEKTMNILLREKGIIKMSDLDRYCYEYYKI